MEDLSENYLERIVLERGHVLLRPRRDYGIDVSMFHFDHSGEIENGEVRFQLKATDSPSFVENGAYISVQIDARDLRAWAFSVYPIVLILFDASHEIAYWLRITEYVDQHPEALNPHRRKARIRIPCANELSASSIDLFRRWSLELIDKLPLADGEDDASRKPR